MSRVTYVVMTTLKDPVDVILVTTDRDQAENIRDKVLKREPIEGLNYEYLQDFKEVLVVARPLNEPLRNEEI
jgi:hypothetical protein